MHTRDLHWANYDPWRNAGLINVQTRLVLVSRCGAIFCTQSAYALATSWNRISEWFVYNIRHLDVAAAIYKQQEWYWTGPWRYSSVEFKVELKAVESIEPLINHFSIRKWTFDSPFPSAPFFSNCDSPHIPLRLLMLPTCCGFTFQWTDNYRPCLWRSRTMLILRHTAVINHVPILKWSSWSVDWPVDKQWADSSANRALFYFHS